MFPRRRKEPTGLCTCKDAVHVSSHGGMADTTDLNPVAFGAYRFKSGWEYKKTHTAAKSTPEVVGSNPTLCSSWNKLVQSGRIPAQKTCLDNLWDWYSGNTRALGACVVGSIPASRTTYAGIAQRKCSALVKRRSGVRISLPAPLKIGSFSSVWLEQPPYMQLVGGSSPSRSIDQ